MNFDNVNMDSNSNSDSEYEEKNGYQDDSNLSEEEYIDKCPVCNITPIINNPDTERTCSLCNDVICLKCIAITEKESDVGECINCFNKECQECTSDITKQLEEYLEEKELPLYIEENTKVLNCDECYKKYYT